ncbi:septum site-determining protein Ssd [Frankia sp. AiPa1]|uniref:septum site-determining protein Ssd n=1 Tax=Frankia sp. AiPa1 TaxID=573492 RepID=UPI00202B46C3|nr:septum site-determining protein Ssd [Frankia sp. AiPa1]MCL9761869.1 hypothetical protein [Frankia sp. AiPa1]
MSPALPPPTTTPPPGAHSPTGAPPPIGSPPPSDRGGDEQPHRPLLVTSRPDLLDDLLRMTVVAGVSATVAVEPAAVRRSWVQAPLVVVGMDRASACLAAGLPPRPQVILVGDETTDSRVWSYGTRLGADHVIFLPAAESWLTGIFAELGGACRSPCVTIGVVAGRRGSGSSTLSVALALAALRNELRTMLVDADPRGGGLGPGFARLLPGADASPSHYGPRALRGADAASLPDQTHRGELSVITWDEATGPEISPLAMTELLSTARATSDLAVFDLPWQPDASAAMAVAACRTMLIVLAADPQAVTTARRVRATIARHCADIRAVIRLDDTPMRDPAQIGKALGVPVAAVLPEGATAFDDQLLAALDLVDLPSAGGRGPGTRA